MPLSTRLRPLFSATFLKFALVGASGVIVNLGALAAFSAFGMRASIASALAIQVSIVTNFLINDRWTFADQQHEHSWPVRAMRFQLISLVGAVVQWTIFNVGNVMIFWALNGGAAVDAWADGRAGVIALAVHTVAHPPPVGWGIYISQLVGIGIATGWNFFANLFWTWRASPE